jgi:signal transduction histidine kinase/ActR/RegA family two-component response regulator
MSSDLSSLATRAVPVGPDTPGAEVYRRFEQEPDLFVLPVIDEERRPLGIVDRNTFFLRMAAEYGRALYAHRPISVLMNTSPLIAEGSTTVAEFTGEALDERPSELMLGFIVVEDGRYLGVGTLLSLLQATSVANRAHAEEMTRIAERLNIAKVEAQSALTAKSQFLAVMSHEIRTPLNGVLAIADILERKLNQVELKPYVQTIIESGETLLRLLTDALDISRAESGVMDLAEDGFCLSQLLDDLDGLWRPRAEQKGVSLWFSYRGPPDQWALGDVIRFKQVFNNLIGNALKFTDRGVVEVSLSAEPDAGHVRVIGEVRDSGIGVPPERLDAIFTPFSQTDAGRSQGGAGLGLSICREIVSRMGGSIEARNNPGQGTTFAFEVVLFDVPPEAEAGATASQSLSFDKPLHILIADDNATNRFVAATLVEMFGCTSETVEDGEAAVEAAAGGRHDLILMDIRMPVMDGLEATRTIRGLSGPVSTVPILALTANADPWDAAQYMNQGMDGVVEKPIKADLLAAAIEGAMASRQARVRAA